MNKMSFLDSELDFTVDTFKRTLTTCLFDCTGREFDGTGVLPLKARAKILEDAGADEFVAKYPDLCPEFTELYQEKRAFVDRGAIAKREAWYNHYR